MNTRNSYLICTTPRCGSWLLANALESTRVAGNPREYFGIDHEDYWISRLGIQGDEYFDTILNFGTTPNRWFGAKLHWSQLGHLVYRLWSRPGCNRLAAQRLLPAVFPNLRYIWLSRQDKARQAVSYARAFQTDVWRVCGQTPTDHAAPVFDYSQVAYLEAMLVEHDGNWQRYFAASDVKPWRVTYEDLAANYEKTVAGILNHLGTADSSIPPPGLKKQADQISEEWVGRYRTLRQRAAAG